MNCLFIFKRKSSKRSKGESRSAPELRNKTRSSENSENPSFNLPTPRSLPSPRSIQELYTLKENSLRVFSYQELSDATNGFNRMRKIGEGGFGSVYKGTIRVSSPDGDSITAVAIKKLNKNGLQGHKQWLAEVHFLGVINHPNVVKLLGYCCDDDERGIQRLLVYEFMSNRSLEDHLISRSLPVLPFKKRLEIMHGAARGLAYLHRGLEIEVIYRDFKPSNVLLDEELNAKLSDFGLAREGPTGDRTHVSTAKVGTYGYAAPEYVATGHLRVQSDVWSFGVVLYEILTGRRTIERNRPTSEQKLLDWVRQFPPDSKRFSMIIDPRLRNNYSVSIAKRVAKLADSCLTKTDKERPAMRNVVETLKLIVEEMEDAVAVPPAAAGGFRGRSR